MNTIRPELKRLHSPDVYDLRNASIDESKPYCVLIQAMFGPENVDGEESFDLIVCNRLWVEKQHAQGELPDPHQLILERFDIHEIEKYLRKAAVESSGADWEEVASKLGRVGRWEFENYVE